MQRESEAQRSFERQWENNDPIEVLWANNWYSATVVGMNDGNVSVRLEQDVKRVLGYRRSLARGFARVPIINLYPRKGHVEVIRRGASHRLRRPEQCTSLAS